MLGLTRLNNSCGVCSGQSGFHYGSCRYRTYSEDYEVAYAKTDKEDISMSSLRMVEYQAHSTLRDGLDGWMHSENLSGQRSN